MIFPQSKISRKNEFGCHDTYGITGDDYATIYGIQPKSIKKMIDRLMEPIDDDFDYMDEEKDILVDEDIYIE